MKSIIAALEQRCSEQVAKADDLLKSLQDFGWKDSRPARTEPKRETRFAFLDLEETVETPAKALIARDRNISYLNKLRRNKFGDSDASPPGR